MSVYVTNLVINAGSDYNQSFNLTNSQGGVLDLHNYSVFSHLRKTPGSSTYTAFNVTIVDQSNGKINLHLNGSSTQYLRPGRYVYDIMLIRPDTIKNIAVEGTALVRAGISTGCF
jgi:hypothetical protein